MPTGTYIFVKGAVNYEKNDKIGAFAALGARFGIHLLRIRIRRRAADRDKGEIRRADGCGHRADSV